MTCEQARELAALAASGDVTLAERHALDLHNSGCPQCRAEAEGFEGLLAELGVMQGETLPESAGAAVRARVLGRIPRRHRPGWLAAWPALAAVIACSAMVVVLMQPGATVRRPEPQKSTEAPVQSAPAEIASTAPIPEALPTTRRHVPRAAPKAPAEPTVVHMFTSDPDVVIYWIADTNRKSSDTGAM